MAILVFFVTIIVGLYATSIFGGWINWPQAGPVFAIAVVGAFLMREVRKLTREEPPELAEDPWKKREREAAEEAKREQGDNQP